MLYFYGCIHSYVQHAIFESLPMLIHFKLYLQLLPRFLIKPDGYLCHGKKWYLSIFSRPSEDTNQLVCLILAQLIIVSPLYREYQN